MAQLTDLSISVSTQVLSKGFITLWSGRWLLSLLWHWLVAKQGRAEHNEIWFSDVLRTISMCCFQGGRDLSVQKCTEIFGRGWVQLW